MGSILCALGGAVNRRALEYCGETDSHLNACKNHYRRLKPINPILTKSRGVSEIEKFRLQKGS